MANAPSALTSAYATVAEAPPALTRAGVTAAGAAGAVSGSSNAHSQAFPFGAVSRAAEDRKKEGEAAATSAGVGVGAGPVGPSGGRRWNPVDGGCEGINRPEAPRVPAHEIEAARRSQRAYDLLRH